MLDEHYATQEKALYSAIVALDEGASLAKRLVKTLGPEFHQQLEEEARNRQAEAETLRKLLADRRTFSIE
jgi:hypothetical protein